MRRRAAQLADVAKIERHAERVFVPQRQSRIEFEPGGEHVVAPARRIQRLDAQPHDGQVGVGIHHEAAVGEPLGLLLFPFGVSLLREDIATATGHRKEKA